MTALNTPEKWRTYERERKRRYRASRMPITRPFVGVDGEGGNVDGRHEYLLLTVGDRTLTTGKPLTADECLAFLTSHEVRRTYVAYYFDYDVTMICRGMPAERVNRLLDRELRKGKFGYYPLDYRGFQLDYIPGKEFRVRRSNGPWYTIHDVGPFFQCSFLTAIAKWGIGTESEREVIGHGKALRSSFTELTAETQAYNALEIRLLESLMHSFRDVCEAIGYMPRKWQGPGYLAETMMRQHGVTRSRDLTLPYGVVKAAQASYYGGRFETTSVGEINRPVIQFDINSAYPYALTQLPCLLHGSWRSGGYAGNGLALCYGHFRKSEGKARHLLYSFPVRRADGSIYYPAEGSGWYWQHEINTADGQQFDVLKRLTYYRECSCTPFDWVPEIYTARLALGKSVKGTVLKLGLNSIYGKTCQSIGSAPYANPVYASLITSLTRAQINRVIHGWTKDTKYCLCHRVHMIATDGVFSDCELPVPLSSVLGEWERTDHPDLFIVQPGLYFSSVTDAPKTRGLPRQAVLEYREQFLGQYALLYESGKAGEHTVTVPLTQFVGLRQARHRNRFDLAGQWLPVTREMSFDWSRKRGEKTYTEGRTIRTYPQDGGSDVHSVPYSRDIGRMLDSQRIAMDDQPDWADVLYTLPEETLLW